MAAGLGFKTFNTGDILSAADVNGYLMQGVLVFNDATARDAAITSPQEGQFAYTKDNNSLWYYSGSAWVASGATGDIEGVTAGVGISGGGTSGTVTITNSMATAIDAKGDLVVGTGADTFSKLTVGANGTTLVADSAEATGLKWATASSGGMTLLSTTTLSGNSTVTLSSISGSYTDLRLVYLGVYGNSSSTDMNMQLRLNGDTGSNYESSYLRTMSTYQILNDTGATRIIIGKNNNASTTINQINGIVDLPRYTDTSGSQLVTGIGWNGFNAVGQMVNGLYTARSAAITSITIFIEGGGTQFSGGTVYLYGVK